MARTIFIGDIHGCLDELRELERVLSITSSDNVIALGDLMDRGPDPVGVVRYLRGRGWQSILGNHDEKHIRWRRHELNRKLSGKSNPMQPMGPVRGAQNDALSDDDVAWLRSLPVTIQGPGWVAVHGGMEPKPLSDQRADRVLRTRFINLDSRESAPVQSDLSQPPNSTFWSEIWPGPQTIVYGHAVHSLESPRIDDHGSFRCFGIDTGCCFGGKLTALVTSDDLQTWKIVQVDSFKEYVPYIPGMNAVKIPASSCNDSP